MALLNKSDKSISEVARFFKIPTKILSDWVNGNHTELAGHPTVLTQKQEKALLKALIEYMTKQRFPLNIKQIQGFALAIALKSERKKQFPKTGPSEKWWRGFKGRHKNAITLCKPDNLDHGRARMTNENVMMNHFQTLKDLLVEHDLLDKPENLFNVDESGINMDIRQGKVVVTKGLKQVHSMSKGTRDHITVNCCINANGKCIPPMIFEKCFLSTAHVKEGNKLYAKSTNGYMDEELF